MSWGDIFPAIQSGIVDGAICCTTTATYSIFAKSDVGTHFVPVAHQKWHGQDFKARIRVRIKEGRSEIDVSAGDIFEQGFSGSKLVGREDRDLQAHIRGLDVGLDLLHHFGTLVIDREDPGELQPHVGGKCGCGELQRDSACRQIIQDCFHLLYLSS
jgi:hypothetical protein